MTDLRTTYLGLALRSPIVASAGPHTSDPDRLAALDDAGVGAVVLPSLFEEQVEHELAETDRLYSLHHESFVEATSFFPDMDTSLGVADRYVAFVEAAKRRVGVPVIASLNGTHLGGWLRYARLLEAAGADAIELNLYEIAAEPALRGAAVEAEQLDLVAAVCDRVRVPVSVKISPFYTSVSAFAVGLQEAGAKGVVMFNRFYLPDLDLETLDVSPRLSLSTSDEVRLPLRWIGIVRQYLRISLAGSTGVHRAEDVVKLLLAGADVAMTTSAVLRQGPRYVTFLEEGLRTWMVDRDYRSVAELRGAARRETAADPEGYERANYIGNLATYTSRFLGEHPAGRPSPVPPS